MQTRAAERGLTLVEVIVGTALTLLLFFGALTVYVAAAQLSIRTTAACDATTDAANAVQHTIRDAEEARWLALPGTADWTAPPGVPASTFQTIDSGTTLSTGVELVSPATAAVSVQSRGGGALPVTPLPYDRSQDGAAPNALWMYRSDRDGTPDAAAGPCLWMYGMEQGRTVNRALLSSLSPAVPNAVQFSRPQTMGTQTLPYQLQVRLVSSDYSPILQAQTSEIRSTAQETIVVGKCVLLRDHEMNLDHEATVTPAYTATNASVWRSD